MSLSSDIPLEIIYEPEGGVTPGPRKYFFGLNILIPYYTSYLNFIRKLQSRYGDVVFFKAGNENIFLVNDPGFIEHILITNPDNYLRGTGFTRLRMLLGDGLLSTDGAIQKKHRAMIQPSFHRSSIGGYVKLINDTVEKEISKWNSKIDLQNNSVDLFLIIICKLLFGNALPGKLIPTVKFFDSLTYDYKALVSIGMPKLARKLPFTWARNFSRSVENLDKIIYSVIEERKCTDKGCNDILSLLLSARDENGEALSDKEIRDELITILFAAYDTSARTLTWALILLSQNPSVLENLRSSIKEGSSSYTEMVISEALRLYPPAHSITRITDKEDRYKNHFIPAGSSIIISPYLIQRNKRYFDRPLNFIPERWDSGNKPVNRFTYLPFGAGKRSCMGEVFARMQVNSALRYICNNSDFTIHGKIKESSSLTLKPSGKVTINLNVRRR